MHKSILAVLILFSGFFHAVSLEAAPPAVAGYGKTTWGMSPQKVLAAEAPRAKAPAKPEQDNNGADGLVRIPSLKIGSINFSATFWFDANRKLREVTLNADEEKNDLINIDNFAELERLLTEKYGPPTYRTDLHPQAEGEHIISWKLPKTTIQLTHAYIPRMMTILLIRYLPSALAAEDSRDL